MRKKKNEKTKTKDTRSKNDSFLSLVGSKYKQKMPHLINLPIAQRHMYALPIVTHLATQHYTILPTLPKYPRWSGNKPPMRCSQQALSAHRWYVLIQSMPPSLAGEARVKAVEWMFALLEVSVRPPSWWANRYWIFVFSLRREAGKKMATGKRFSSLINRKPSP